MKATLIVLIAKPTDDVRSSARCVFREVGLGDLKEVVGVVVGVIDLPVDVEPPELSVLL